MVGQPTTNQYQVISHHSTGCHRTTLSRGLLGSKKGEAFSLLTVGDAYFVGKAIWWEENRDLNPAISEAPGRSRKRSVGANNSNFTMVYGTQITIVFMWLFQPTNITGGPHLLEKKDHNRPSIHQSWRSVHYQGLWRCVFFFHGMDIASLDMGMPQNHDISTCSGVLKSVLSRFRMEVPDSSYLVSQFKHFVTSLPLY